jgi:predicted  nucleic acid-binding Zn-ribbon protein
MTYDSAEHTESPGQGLLGVLMSPLAVPRRVASDIESIASALLSLQRDVQTRLRSVDERSGELVDGLGELGEGLQALREPLDEIDRKVTELQKLEQAVTMRMDAIQHDLNERMLAVETEVHGMRAPIAQMSRDVENVSRLLPEPGDGPFARLKDTFTAS